MEYRQLLHHTTVGAGPELARGRQPGQAMVELALALPLLLAFVLGFIAILQATIASYTVAQAARAGATRGAVHGYNTVEIKQTVERVLNTGLLTSADDAHVAITCLPPAGFTGCPRYSAIKVEVRYEGPLAMPIGPLTRVAAHASSLRTSELDQHATRSEHLARGLPRLADPALRTTTMPLLGLGGSSLGERNDLEALPVVSGGRP